MKSVMVYSRPRCVQCVATYRGLEQAGISFEVVDLSTCSDATMAYVMELGHMQAPIVVVTDQDHWAGFRPDHIARVAKLYRQDA